MRRRTASESDIAAPCPTCAAAKRDRERLARLELQHSNLLAQSGAHERTIDGLREQLASAESALAATRTELDDVRGQAGDSSRMAAELSTLRTRLRDADSAGERKDERLAKAEARAAGLKIDLEAALSARPPSPVPAHAPPTPPAEPSPRKAAKADAATQRALDEALAKIGRLERETKALHVERRKTRCEFLSRRANSKFDDLAERGVEVAKYRRVALEQKFARLEVERRLVMATSAIGEAEERVEALQSSLEERDEQLSELRAQLDDGGDKVDASELASLRKAASDSKALAKAAKSDLRDMRDDFESSLSNAQDLQRKLSAAQAEIAELKVRRASLILD